MFLNLGTGDQASASFINLDKNC